jgi:hypothetical protein
VLVRGPNVFAGYWRLPEKTRETIDADGWLHTGDCGEIDADGYLSIKDRLKDIIITSGGKNITPSNIESHLKFSPYVSDAVVIGEGRNYLTCLIMLDQDNVAKFAQDRQVPYTDYRQHDARTRGRGADPAELEQVNTRLARVEQIKDFRIIAQLLTAEDDELTPTMKLKRKVVAKKYADVIDDVQLRADFPVSGCGPFSKKETAMLKRLKNTLLAALLATGAGRWRAGRRRHRHGDRARHAPGPVRPGGGRHAQPAQRHADAPRRGQRGRRRQRPQVPHGGRGQRQPAPDGGARDRQADPQATRCSRSSTRSARPPTPPSSSVRSMTA